jgi:hypothetical protein
MRSLLFVIIPKSGHTWNAHYLIIEHKYKNSNLEYCNYILLFIINRNIVIYDSILDMKEHEW